MHVQNLPVFVEQQFLLHVRQRFLQIFALHHHLLLRVAQLEVLPLQAFILLLQVEHSFFKFVDLQSVLFHLSLKVKYLPFFVRFILAELHVD